jgi:hypothetical protein
MRQNLTRSTRITKKQQAARDRFKAKVTEWLLSVGAKPSTTPVGLLGFPYDYTLETTLGTLHISPYDNWVACRWDDVPRALAGHPKPAMNPYSGKWNFHFEFADDRAAVNCAFDFAVEVQLYLCEQPTATTGSTVST